MKSIKNLKLLALGLMFVVFFIPVQGQRLLKKELITNNYEKDGFEYKWYRYMYLQGRDTLYAAFDLNGQRITPNIKKDSPYYTGGGMFIWRNGGKDSWGNLIYIGYNLKGEKIFSESLEATFVFYSGDGVFILSKRNDYGREINAVFNSRGECLIPFSMGYNFIAYYPEMMCFWCSYKDASGSEIECHTYSADVRY